MPPPSNARDGRSRSPCSCSSPCRSWPSSPPCRSPGAGGSAGTTSSSRSSSTSSPATASRSASTATSPTARSRPTAPLRIGLAVAGLARDRGPGHPLGRRPPPAPRVQRPRGRPALALALRRRHPARWPRDCGSRTSAGCSTRADQPRAVRARPARRPATSSGSTGCFPLLVAVSLLAARRSLGGLITMSLAGRADRVLLGRPGPRRAAAPRHLVDQLDLPHDRRAPVRSPRPRAQRLVAGDPARWASPGTTCTTPTRPAPGTAYARPARLRARVIWLFEKLGWATTSAGRRASA